MPKKQKVQPTRAEAGAIRKRVIEYYETTANCSKHVTTLHFAGEVPKTTIYGVLKTYEQRKAEGWKGKAKPCGKMRTTTTPENLKRYEELHRMDPKLSVTEAAEILNLTWRQVKAIRGAFKKSLNAAGNGNQSESEEDEENLESWGLGKNRIESNCSPEGQPPVKLKKGRQRCRCLACFEQFEENPPEIRNSDKFNKSLNMMFVFKVILDMTSEDMLELMKLSKGRNPCDWVNFCGSCEPILEEAIEIQKKIRKLEESLKKCKQKIVDNVWSSSGLKSKKKGKGVSAIRSVVVTNRVREMILERGRIPPPCLNPYEEGDREAESRIKALIHSEMELPPQIEVKQEVDDNLEAAIDHLVDFPDNFANCRPSSFNGSNLDSQEISDKQNAELEVTESTSTAENSARPATVENFLNYAGNPPGSDSASFPLSLSTQGICDLCGVEMRPLAIPTHKLMHHDVVMEGYTVKRCENTGCKYKTLYDRHFRMHIKNHETNKAFSCGFCGKGFADKSKLAQHEEIHTNAETRPYICEICGNSFAVKTYLYLHKRMSHQRRYFPSTKRKRP